MEAETKDALLSTSTSVSNLPVCINDVWCRIVADNIATSHLTKKWLDDSDIEAHRLPMLPLPLQSVVAVFKACGFQSCSGRKPVFSIREASVETETVEAHRRFPISAECLSKVRSDCHISIAMRVGTEQGYV